MRTIKALAFSRIHEQYNDYRKKLLAVRTSCKMTVRARSHPAPIAVAANAQEFYL